MIEPVRIGDDVTLFKGDCLEVMAGMEEGSVDAIITDLPYGTTACSWDEIIPFAPMWEQAGRINKGAFVTTASQPFTSALVMSNPKWFKYEWIWEKAVGSNFAVAKYQPLKEHENILVFCENKTVYNPIREKRKGTGKARLKNGYKSNGTKTEVTGMTSIRKGKTYDELKYPSSVQYFNNRESNRGLHPTQKPVALYAYLIKTYTNPGDTVLDITMGSGTTGKACQMTGRKFIGIEKDAHYFDVAVKRLSEPVQKELI